MTTYSKLNVIVTFQMKWTMTLNNMTKQQQIIIKALKELNKSLDKTFEETIKSIKNIKV
jgi:hypothetical protein